MLLISRRLWWRGPRGTLRTLSGSIEERDTIQPCNLTSANVRTLEVGVEHHVEVERPVLAGVVDANVQVQLLLPEDDPVGDLEVMLPHAVGEITVTEREYCLDVSARHPLRALLQLPLADASKAVVGRPVHPIVPLSELGENEGNSAPNWLSAVKHRFLADK